MQSVSAVGLKYLELEKGTSSQTLKAGATIPVSQAREPVDIDQLFNMFDQKTRTAIQQNTINFGDGLAGRGLGLNNTIATLRPLVTNATPALRNLASPKTGLHELWIALDRVASQTAPVAQANANVFSYLDTFFTAFAGVSPSLEQAIEGGPAALEQATYSLPLPGAVGGKEHRVHAPAAPDRERAAHLRTAARPRVRSGRRQPARRHRAELGAGRCLEGVPSIRPEPSRDARPGRPDPDGDARQPARSRGSRPSRSTATT